MFTQYYSFTEISKVDFFGITKKLDAYTDNVKVICQVQKLIQQIAESLQFDVNFNYKKQNRVDTQEYVFLDNKKQEVMRIEYKSHAPLAGVAKVVRNPMSIGQVNRVLDKVTRVIDNEATVKEIYPALCKIVHYNEDDNFIEAYEEDGEFALMLESKKGRQSLEIYIQ